MTTLKTTLNTGRAHSAWVIALLWFVATYAGAIAYAIPMAAVHFLLGLDRLEDPQRAGELGTVMLVLAAVLCGAACGSTIGLAQWLVLRRELKNIGLWVGATIAGYASIGLLILLGNIFEPGWLNWAVTVIVNGKMYWLARVQPTWQGSSWLPGAITLVLFGIVLGIIQWLVLRRRVRHAGWWIAVSAGGMVLGAALSTSSVPWATFVCLVWAVPILLGAAGLVLLLRSSHPTVQAAN